MSLSGKHSDIRITERINAKRAGKGSQRGGYFAVKLPAWELLTVVGVQDSVENQGRGGGLSLMVRRKAISLTRTLSRRMPRKSMMRPGTALSVRVR